MVEAQAILILCAMLGGRTEQSVLYTIDAGSYHVRVDCITSDEVIEVGLDGKRDSYDSLHQVVFAAELTGNSPRVIMIDRDGIEDRFQYQVRSVSRKLDVAYCSVDSDLLTRWHMTSYLRSIAGGPSALVEQSIVNTGCLKNILRTNPFLGQ
jgi:hypothetical protein